MTSQNETVSNSDILALISSDPILLKAMQDKVIANKKAEQEKEEQYQKDVAKRELNLAIRNSKSFADLFATVDAIANQKASAIALSTNLIDLANAILFVKNAKPLPTAQEVIVGCDKFVTVQEKQKEEIHHIVKDMMNFENLTLAEQYAYYQKNKELLDRVFVLSEKEKLTEQQQKPAEPITKEFDPAHSGLTSFQVFIYEFIKSCNKPVSLGYVLKNMPIDLENITSGVLRYDLRIFLNRRQSGTAQDTKRNRSTLANNFPYSKLNRITVDHDLRTGNTCYEYTVK